MTAMHNQNQCLWAQHQTINRPVEIMNSWPAKIIILPIGMTISQNSLTVYLPLSWSLVEGHREQMIFINERATYGVRTRHKSE